MKDRVRLAGNGINDINIPVSGPAELEQVARTGQGGQVQPARGFIREMSRGIAADGGDAHAD